MIRGTNHGTPVAGVVGAKANNAIGIAGVASSCKLMDISHPLEGALEVQQYADGIMKA
jgi:subtilisin family serine protease